MRKKRKFIIITVTAATVAALMLSGAVFADEPLDTPPNPIESVISRVADKLGIDQEELEIAFQEAVQEERAERMDNHLDRLVENGKITEEEAEQYQEWWQDKPDVPFGQGHQGRFGGHGPCPGMGMRGMQNMPTFPGSNSPSLQ